MKAAKIGGRQRGNTIVVEEDLSIEYLEMTMADVVTEVATSCLLRTNHGVVEAVSKDCKGLLGMDRAGLEAHIIQGEESGLDISLRSLVGINMMRISIPCFDTQLVHKMEVID